ncbi:hypothetical protein SAMN05443432_1188 [Roseovarius litoreus]|uniref:Aspartate/glutamate racemase family protein n=1 Tax=Roseovarius litoreus TaxID=1155722 RepID=A0A1M7LLS8_9RHOB|nr:aspartate/glutamate racemase family protein [Roseovarius litoreus]SHM78958.1 hypothetical protein SAMN05443432_1188 [Roseovarius litoreus]
MIYKANAGQDIYGAPIGILVMDCLIPYPPGTPGNAQTFDHPVIYEVVRGADMENLVYDPKPELLERFVAAGERLVQQGARTVIGNCGFMVLYQREMAAALPVPVFMSGLLQLPLIRQGLQPDQSIGVITASGRTLSRRHMEIACWGGQVPVNVRGLEDRPAFKAAVHDQVGWLDFPAVEAEVVETARSIQADHPETGAILLECTDLPPYAEAVQRATGLPVYDITSMIGWAFAGADRKHFSHKGYEP